MDIMSSAEFVHIFSDIWGSTDRRFCFILGAGASKSSGIRTGGELAKIWLQEIKDRKKGLEAEFDKFITDNKIDIDNPGASYPEIYQQRFWYDFDSGVEYINNELESAKPGYGYSVLAQILAEKQHNIIITTNFDNLTEEALYTYTSSRPLVCGHESLAIFANPSLKRPLIIKIHRDRFMSPQSRPEEIGNINKDWVGVLNQIFSISIPVFIGYGGNDGSMMGYLEEVSSFRNIFWCERKGTLVSNSVQALLEKHNGKLVEIDGFDELMFLLQAKLELPLLNDDIKDIASKRSDEYWTTFQKINATQSASSDQEVQNAAKKIVSDAGDNWWAWELKAKAATSLNDRDKIYQQAIGLFPSNSDLKGNYALFLQDELCDFDRAEQCYKETLALDPQHANNTNNFATFMETARKNYERAEELYIKALSLNSNLASANNNYAGFLSLIKNDQVAAEFYFKKSISLNLSGPCYTKYAIFLATNRRYDEAEELYQRALVLSPNNSDCHSCYAEFLKNTKKDYVKAEKYFLKSVELNPLDSNENCNCAGFLLSIGRKEEARQYLMAAISSCKNDIILAEVHFYHYAHYDEKKDALDKLVALLCDGIRSADFNLQDNVDRAIQDGHPDPVMLQRLADTLTKDAPIGDLCQKKDEK